MNTRVLIGSLVSLVLLVTLFPAGMGAPELVGLLLIAVALVAVWSWRRRTSKAPGGRAGLVRETNR